MRQFNEYLSTKVNINNTNIDNEIIFDILKVTIAVASYFSYSCLKETCWHGIYDYTLKIPTTCAPRYGMYIINILNNEFGYNYNKNDLKESGIIRTTINKYKHDIEKLYTEYKIYHKQTQKIKINNDEFNINIKEDIRDNIDDWIKSN